VTPWSTYDVVRAIKASMELQFGHGGDAVEHEDMTLPTALHLMLQFGHGGDAVEHAEAVDLDADGQRASIRPRR
jgi:hypothetical protein